MFTGESVCHAGESEEDIRAAQAVFAERERKAAEQRYAAEAAVDQVARDRAAADAAAADRAAAGQAAPDQGAGERQVVVDNRVTDGGGMREDTPAYLSTEKRNYCMSNGCTVAGTGVGSGTRLTALCQSSGEPTTNGQDCSAVADANPGLVSSDRWYRVRHPGGATGWLSEVWLEAPARGGLGLPAC